MIFTESPLPGVFLVDLEPLNDERGFFARSYASDEFAAQGLAPELGQCSVSYNARKGTLRGLHYQSAPNSSEADRKSTRLNSSHTVISYAVFCLKNKNCHDVIALA